MARRSSDDRWILSFIVFVGIPLYIIAKILEAIQEAFVALQTTLMTIPTSFWWGLLIFICLIFLNAITKRILRSNFFLQKYANYYFKSQKFLTLKAKVAKQLNAQSPYHAHSFWYVEDASPTILASQKAINEFLFPRYIKFLHKDKWEITYENIQGKIPTKIKKYCPDRIEKELGVEVVDSQYLCNLYAEYYFKTGILPTKNKVTNIINTNSRQWAQQFLYLIYPEHISESLRKSLRDSQKAINEFLLPRGQKLILKSEAQAIYKLIKLEIPPIIAKLHSPKIRSALGFTPIDFTHLCNAFSAYYFTTTRFIAIKGRIAKYIAECNELNTHIENLTDENLYAQKPDYGEVSTIDTSFYNYSRPHYLQNKSDKNTHYTNNINLYKNAETQPFSYFCKYFDIDKNEKSLQDFEASLNGFCAINSVLSRKERQFSKSKRIKF